MGFKHRVGNFLILFGLIGLLIFGASVLAPPTNSFDLTAFVAGAVLLLIGLNFRLSKSGGTPYTGGRPAAAKAAPKSGPPGGGKPGAPKKQGLASLIMKGPADKRLPPKPAPSAGGKPGGGKKK